MTTVSYVSSWQQAGLRSRPYALWGLVAEREGHELPRQGLLVGRSRKEMPSLSHAVVA